MKFPLGAMTIGDILDRGLKVLFARLPTFYLVNLIILFPALLVLLCAPLILGMGDQVDPAAMIGFGLALILSGLVALLLQPIATAAILHIVMEEYAGRRSTVREALSFAMSRFLTLFGASFLYGLLIFVGGCLLCIPGIYFWVTYAFVAQVVVLEKLGISDGFQRSQTLVSGYRWRVFGILLTVLVVNVGIQQVVKAALETALPSQEVIPAEGGARLKFNTIHFLIGILVPQLVSILFTTFMAVCTTLLYLDLRIRKEGFDLELAAQLGEEPSDRDRDRYDDDRDRYDDDRGRYDDDRHDDRRRGPEQ